jgi:hypothetical protein
MLRRALDALNIERRVSMNRKTFDPVFTEPDEEGVVAGWIKKMEESENAKREEPVCENSQYTEGSTACRE